MSSPFPLPKGWGWDLSRFVPVPDQFFDTFLPHLSPSETSVLLYIFRRTLGFRKAQDAISLSQLLKGIPGKDQGTGLSYRTLRRAIQALQAKRLIERLPQAARSGRSLPSLYRLPRRGAKITPLGVSEMQEGGVQNLHSPEGCKNDTPQDTEIQIYTREGPPLPTSPKGSRDPDSGHWPEVGTALRAGRPPQKAGTPPAITAETASRREEPSVPAFENEHLRSRWERIYSWFNQKRPLDSLTPYEKRLAYRQIEEAVRDPDFEPPPPGWKPPTFEEVLEKLGREP